MQALGADDGVGGNSESANQRISESANQSETANHVRMKANQRTMSKDNTQYAIRNTGYAARITGATRLVGVIGWPVSHSRSPRMHNAAFASLGLDWAYVPLPVAPERVGEAVRGLAALGFAGANVTVPHKQAVMPFLDELTPVARAVGAVNTDRRPARRLTAGRQHRRRGVHGGSAGAWRANQRISESANRRIGESASEHHRVTVSPCHPVTLSPCPRDRRWGAARAVVYALAEAGATVAVTNRTPERAQELCQTIIAALPRAAGRLSAHPFPGCPARVWRQRPA